MDKPVENQNRLIDAAVIARDRGRQVTDEYIKSVADAQRDALELTKELTAHPSVTSKNVETILESVAATRVQDGNHEELPCVRAEIRLEPGGCLSPRPVLISTVQWCLSSPWNRW